VVDCETGLKVAHKIPHCSLTHFTDYSHVIHWSAPLPWVFSRVQGKTGSKHDVRRRGSREPPPSRDAVAGTGGSLAPPPLPLPPSPPFPSRIAWSIQMRRGLRRRCIGVSSRWQVLDGRRKSFRWSVQARSAIGVMIAQRSPYGLNGFY